MSFTPAWLSLREPYDTAALDPALLRHLAAWARARDRLAIVDLGAGTGANLRRLRPHLGTRQDWTLVEIDPTLIAAGQRLVPEARYRRLDLARDLEALASEAPDLITASALLDLVSGDWLRRLAALQARLACALHLTLSYDGRIAWQPHDPFDETAHDLVNRHQRTDKGFGPALGPEAAAGLTALLPAGTLLARSDWRLGKADRTIQHELLDGYATAATAMAPERAAELDAWRQRRLELIAAGASTLAVGHLDLLYLPTSRA